MAYYNFMSEVTGASANAKRIARSTTPSGGSGSGNLSVGDIDAEYATASSGVITFTKTCKVLVHYEVTSTALSTWVEINLFKNDTSFTGGAVRATNPEYKNGSYVLDIEPGDKIRGTAAQADGGGGSVAHYTIYALTTE